MFVRGAGAKLIEIGIFCDTDETGAQSIAYFSDIRALKTPAGTSGMFKLVPQPRIEALLRASQD